MLDTAQVVGSQLQMLYHQDTKLTKEHQANTLFFFVFLGELGVLVARFYPWKVIA
jgi:hypothetical protein